MFTVNVNDKTVKFTFRHTRDCNFKVKPNKIVTDVTSCLFEVDGKSFDSVAACLAGDQFIKEKGRKIALARALGEAKLSRDERKAVWQAYFKRDRPTGKEIKVESLMKYASGLQLEDEYDNA